MPDVEKACRFAALREHTASECPECHPGGWMLGQTCSDSACHWCRNTPGEPS